MAEPIDVVLVGAGAVARAYLQACAQVPELRPVAIVDPRPEAAAALVGLPWFPDLPSYEHRGPRAAAAFVLAPPVHHEPLTVALLARGMHVLCEKPLAIDVPSAQRMLAAARAAGCRLMMGSKFRYTPDVLGARELLDAGRCGDVVLYENVFCSPVDMTHRWNSRRSVSGGGVLIDNGCHSVDLARYLLGPIARVQAQFGRRAQAIEVEDTARLLFTSASGALGSIDLSWSMHKETDAYVRIHGTRGTIEIGWRASRHKSLGGAWQAFGCGYDKIAAFAGQLRNFAACIRGEATPWIDDDDALASVVVVDCAYRSAAAERWLPVPDPAATAEAS